MATFADWTLPRWRLIALAAASACAEAPPDLAVSPDPTAPPIAPTAAGEAVELSTLMHRVHFAYRADGDALRIDHETYRARIAAAGSLEVTPRRPGPTPLTGDAVTVHTQGAWLGDRALATTARAPVVQADGSATTERGPVRERFRNTADGVEQTFELDAAPAGDGALRVRVAVTGQDFVAETAGGFHFRSPGSALGLRYGQATWIDAEGAAVALAAHWIEDAIEIVVPAAVLHDAAYPAMIDPVIGPELAVDVPVVAAPADQRSPRVAFDGAGFVAVWADRRGADSDIYGARLDAAGRVIGARNFVVNAAAGAQESPDVACRPGAGCVAVWSSANDIFAARIPLGTGDPGAAFAVSSAVNQQATPQVACDSRPGIADPRCLVTYYDLRGGVTSDIFGRMIKLEGIDGTPELAISTAAGSQFGPQVVFAGTQYVVAWQDGGGAPTARAARVLPDRTVRDPAGFAVSTGSLSDRPCAVASDGSNALVVYTRGTTFPMPLFAQRVDAAAGGALGAAVRLDTANGYLCGADFDGSNYLTTWADASLKVAGRRISPAGAVVDAVPITLSGAPTVTGLDVDVAFGAGTHLLTWEDSRSFATTGYDIRGARVAPDLTRTTPLDTLVSLVAIAGSQSTPDVARNFQSYLVVWSDTRAGNTDIYGARFDDAGRLLDPAAITISTAAAAQARPAVASDGKVFFVVWEDARDLATGRNIYGARVDAGLVLDPAGFAVSTVAGDQADPDIAFDEASQRFLAVWSDKRAATTDIYGSRIDRAGVVLDPAGVAISAFPGSDQTQPAVASVADRFLVVWSDTISGVSQIWGAILRSDATLAAFDFPVGGADTLKPAVASDGTSFLTAWQRRDFAAIEGRAVSSTAGLLTGVLTLSPVLSGASDVALAHDTVHYGVAYNRGQTLFGRRVTSLGAPVDPELLIQPGTGNDIFEPALAAAKPNQFLVAYDRFITAPPAGLRVFGRAVAF